MHVTFQKGQINVPFSFSFPYKPATLSSEIWRRVWKEFGRNVFLLRESHDKLILFSLLGI